MNALCMIIFLISMSAGIVFLGMFIIGLFVKKLKIRPKKSIILFGVCFFAFIFSAFGYTATMSEEQKVEQQLREEQEAVVKAEKEVAKLEANKEKEETKKAEENVNVENIEDTSTEETAEEIVTVPPNSKEETEKQQVATEKADTTEANTNQIVDVPEKKEEVVEKKVEYDELQSIFLNLSKDVTTDDLDKMIADASLSFTTSEYNGTGNEGKSLMYRIAYTDGAAKQKYADSGDSIDVSFSVKDNYQFRYADYNANSKQALLYNYGTWYDFREKEPENSYSGYYFIDLGSSDKKGISITYSNGNTVSTNYYEYDSAESVLNKMMK